MSPQCPRTYEALSLDHRQAYLDCLAACPEKVSDYSFANLWGWAEEYGLEWSWASGCAWVRQTRPEPLYWAPLGNWEKVDWADCPALSQGLEMTRVPQGLARTLAGQLGGRVRVEEDRGHWDYLYKVEELTALKGNRFHKKKNHLNQFKKKYAWDYKPIDTDCVEEVLEMQAEWLEWREPDEGPAPEPLVAENNAIVRVLTRWDVMPQLMGGALRVEGELVAYTVAEPLTEDTLVIHFEKGRPDYRGVYQAINQMFLEHEGAPYRWVNREQDLDDEGLRKAKLSYHPADFAKKCRVRVTPA